MQQKFSLSSKKEAKKKAHIDKVYKRTTGTKLYLSAIGIFFTCAICIIFSPLVTGKSYDYATVKLNEPENISQSLNLYVSDITINKKDGLFKAVLKFKDESAGKSLSNIQTKYKLNYINNKGKGNAKQSVVKLSDEYTVLYYENLPKDFGVISISVEPTYIYPEIEASNDLKDKEVKFYVVQNDIEVDNKMKILSESDLQKENFKYQIESVESEIKVFKEEIKTLKLTNKVQEEDIKKAEQEIDFQTQDEQIETTNDINSMKSTIENNETKIKEDEEKIKNYESKITQLKESADNFS